MTATDAPSLFEQALKSYNEGAPLSEVIASFQQITQQDPRLSAGWTCLAWLQLLDNQAQTALRSARMAVKLNPQDPQARINLSLALLETESKGVRDHIQVVQQVLTMAPQIADDLKGALDDGAQRRPDWAALGKVRAWLDL